MEIEANNNDINIECSICERFCRESCLFPCLRAKTVKVGNRQICELCLLDLEKQRRIYNILQED